MIDYSLLDPQRNWYAQQVNKEFAQLDLGDFMKQFGERVCELGFDVFGLNVNLPRLAAPRAVVFENAGPWARELVGRYLEEGRLMPPALKAHAWTEPFVLPLHPERGEDLLFYETLHTNGYPHAVLVPGPSRNGPYVNAAFLRRERRITAEELQSKLAHMWILVRAAHDHLVPQVLKKLEPVAGVHLTPTEIKILRSACKGRNAEQTAKALGIGVDSVNAHRSNVRRKLGARTPEEVIDKALSLGLL